MSWAESAVNPSDETIRLGYHSRVRNLHRRTQLE